MKPTETTEVVLSPLDAIRQAEAEVARRIAAARDAAERAVVKARAQVSDSKREMLETGQREDQTRYETLIAEAHAEAESILAQAHSYAGKLRSYGEACMEAVVSRAVEDVIGSDCEEDTP